MEVNQELVEYLKHKSQYKIGETERVIYQKINGLKKVNVMLSILYNFSSEGVFDSLPIGLINP